MNKFKVLIEIPQGSNLKYEYDKASKKMKLNFTFTDVVFPFNYGFIQGTLGGDGDELDAIVLSSASLKSGEVLECKAIGILKTIDRGEVDDKIVCVPVGDPVSKGIFDTGDLPKNTLQKWTEFYLEVARQKQKEIKIIGLFGKPEADEEIKNALI